MIIFLSAYYCKQQQTNESKHISLICKLQTYCLCKISSLWSAIFNS